MKKTNVITGTDLRKVRPDTFATRFRNAYNAHANIKAACSSPSELADRGGQCFLTGTHNAGFRIGLDGELTYLYSTVKGQGDSLVQAAIKLGTRKLDRFDGYLVDFYKKHGFVEVKREPNWVAGEPDCVYMVLDTSFTN